MATMITSECINCGACEPECPNNAISQCEEIYVIDPQLCTECVGFHDYEACAAVCPVDCCVTDPNNVEIEDALIARARQLHGDVEFGESFESRFRKKEAEPAASPGQPTGQVAEPRGSVAAGTQPLPHVAQAGASPSEPADRQAPSEPASAPSPSEVRPPKRFPGELPGAFPELLEKHRRKSPLGTRILFFVLQPLLGALGCDLKRELESIVGDAAFFSGATATGLNVLLNLVFYPLALMGLAVGLNGPDILFSQRINGFILAGFLLGLVEGAYRLKEGIFQAKPPGEMVLRGAFYGLPFSGLAHSLLAMRGKFVQGMPVPVDGFYDRGFIEKVERERRYGHAYTIEDLGEVYHLRLEFPKKVPDIGLPVRAELPDEMPDYDYDLILKDGSFIIKGRCVDEKVRSLSGKAGAFPAEFTTVIPLQERILGFSHRCENKLLEVVLLKEKRAA